MSTLGMDCVENLLKVLFGVHLHCWIVTYPLDKVIRPLNNWDQVSMVSQVLARINFSIQRTNYIVTGELTFTHSKISLKTLRSATNCFVLLP